MARKETTRVRESAHFPAFDLSAPPPPLAEAHGTALAPFPALVKRLSNACGPSGSEENVRERVRAEIKGLADQVRVDALGNLIAVHKGSGNGRKKIMLTAPLDEIGVMVTFLDSRGFARVGMLGAVNPSTLPGTRAQFENGTIGVFGRETRAAARAESDASALFLDVGATSAENAPVRVGDAACLVGAFRVSGSALLGKALGGRTSCAVLIETLRRLKKAAHDVYCVFTVQHQLGARGAGAAAYAIQPDYAFVLEPTPALDVPNGGEASIALGKGPAILVQDDKMIASAAARHILMQAARGAHIPYQMQVHAYAGGDGAPIQATREGIVTAALALPTRYLHTSSEMVDPRDAENAIELVLSVLANKGI
jgi:putative aminopeptidase FrvX